MGYSSVMQKIVVTGDASKQIVKSIEVKTADQELTLLELLQKHDLPIASSCLGDGVCQKCITSTKLITCQIKVKDLMGQKSDVFIAFEYL